MGKPQYAILRFAKYKGPEISRIEAHNERTKEQYASNPDVDTARSHLNFHLIGPTGRYREEAQRQIAAAHCRTRSDSVRLVETLITGSPEFFKGKSREEIEDYFRHALSFLIERQKRETFVSAVVHLDEKTPHMHVIFVPLTQDGRLCAKEIIGNRKKMTLWQDEFYRHMTQRYPELDRGESAQRTRRTHVTPQAFKKTVHLDRVAARMLTLLNDSNPLHAKKNRAELAALLEKVLPHMEHSAAFLKQLEQGLQSLQAENAALQSQVSALTPSVRSQLEAARQKSDAASMRRLLDAIPPEILRQAERQLIAGKAAKHDKEMP